MSVEIKLTREFEWGVRSYTPFEFVMCVMTIDAIS